MLTGRARGEEEPWWILNARVLPMGPSERVLEDHAVKIEGGRIAWIGTMDKAGDKAGNEAAAADRVLDAGGRTLIPGLVDCHVHLFDRTQLPLFVANGVTTVLNQSGTPWVLELRERIEAGEQVGPRVFTTGPQIKEEALTATDTEALLPEPHELEAFIRMHGELGYEFVKIWSSIPPYRYEQILAECRRQGVRVTGHVPSRVSLRGALAAGQRSIGHVEEVVNKFFVRTLDPAGLPVLNEIAAAQPFHAITTIITYEMIADTRDDDRFVARMARDEYRFLDPALIALWGSPQNDWYQLRNASRPEGYYDDARDFMLAITGTLHGSDATVLAGTDAGFVVANILPGFSIHRELELLVAAGLSEWEALRAATADPGAFLEPTSGLGSIAVGAPADLVLLEHDPLQSISNTRSIAAVISRGTVFDKSAIRGLLQGAEDAQAPAHGFLDRVASDGVETAVEDTLRDLANGAPVPHEASLLVGSYQRASAGELEQARAFAELSCRLHPRSYRSRLFLAGVGELDGDREETRTQLQEALRLRPGHLLLERRLARLAASPAADR